MVNNIQYFLTDRIMDEDEEDIPENYAVRVVLASEFDKLRDSLKKSLELLSKIAEDDEDKYFAGSAWHEEYQQIINPKEDSEYVFDKLQAIAAESCCEIVTPMTISNAHWEYQCQNHIIYVPKGTKFYI